MKLIVLGASGGCGRQLVAQAVEQGHTVTAVVRSSTWQPPSPAVQVQRGELTDRPFLEQAIRGHDVVLSALGLRFASIAPWSKPEVADLLTRSTPVIIEAMKAAGVKRLIAISAGGVGDSRDAVPGAFRAFVALSAIRHAYAELEVMERLLRASGLEVCIARPTGLTDGPLTKTAKVFRSVKGRATISRADVAWWLLGEASAAAYTGQTPMISVTGG
jgi:putative NADH-flavin reductase